jgi:cytochrome c-type biogenesis protein CcmF
LARKLATHDLAPGTDFDATYHAIQVPLAFLFISITAFTQFLRYGRNPGKPIFMSLLRSLLTALVLTAMVLFSYGFETWEAPRVALLLACLWSAAANADYIIQVLKGRWDHAGASIAHIGFALVIFGAVLSNAKKEVVSQNRFGDLAMLNESLSNDEDLLLLEGDTIAMGPYYVRYRERRLPCPGQFRPLRRTGFHCGSGKRPVDLHPHSQREATQRCPALVGWKAR